jgi:hypothetical protein
MAEKEKTVDFSEFVGEYNPDEIYLDGVLDRMKTKAQQAFCVIISDPGDEQPGTHIYKCPERFSGFND